MHYKSSLVYSWPSSALHDPHPIPTPPNAASHARHPIWPVSSSPPRMYHEETIFWKATWKNKPYLFRGKWISFVDFLWIFQIKSIFNETPMVSHTPSSKYLSVISASKPLHSCCVSARTWRGNWPGAADVDSFQGKSTSTMLNILYD